jgi:hypothetical protein
MAKFPLYSGASFGKSEVEVYLVELALIGWQTCASNKPASYFIVVDEEKRIDIWFFNDFKEWNVESWNQGNCSFHKAATSFQSFKELVSVAMQSLGQVIDSSPKSIRLKQLLPLSNKIRLVHLTRGTAVQCIFDPYFDDKAIASLSSLVNLGLKLIPEAQVLITDKAKKGLSELVITDFEREHGSKLNIRICNSDKEHRCFLLLSSGESLVLGCSLNSLDKNEAARVENSHSDCDFFKHQWKLSHER